MSAAQWVALATGAHLGNKTITHLREHFGNLEAIFEASADELRRVRGVGPKTSAAIRAIRLERVEEELAGLAGQGIRAITCEDKDYPLNLRKMDDQPPVLYVRGTLLAADARAVALVGTRTPTRRGEERAHEMGYELALRGWTIASGLALGIDTLAHQGALDAGGRTLAVLGSGLLNIYPPANQTLAEKIARSGALLAEADPRASVSPQALMARNRITSGLSRAVIVVEAQTDGGSVSTARRARAQGRGMLAVAGGDEGCTALIGEGAEAVDPQDVDWDRLSERLEQHLGEGY